MITVRFPNGQAVQYNDGNYVSRSERYSDIYTRKDGKWIAQIPNTCIIEVVPACRVYNPVDKHSLDILFKISDLERQIKLLRKELKK